MLDEAFRHQVWAHQQPQLQHSATIEGYLQAATCSTAQLIGVEGSYSICTTIYGHLLTVGTSDRDAWQADQVEFDTDEGPCVEALRTGTTAKAIELADERRWPTWSAVAIALGFQSAAGVVAEASPGHRIALNMYSPAFRAFDDLALHQAQLFIEEVARTLPAAVRLFAETERALHLEQALANRSVIDQALGVVMAQNHCTADAAFGILRRASQNSNLKLRDIAVALIERSTGHPSAPAPPFRSPTRRR